MLNDLRFKRATFRALHEQGCFVLPNPWDVGGIRRLEKLGFKALASTSAGAAWALGRNDGELSLDEVLEHLALGPQSGVVPAQAGTQSRWGRIDHDAGSPCSRGQRGRLRSPRAYRLSLSDSRVTSDPPR